MQTSKKHIEDLWNKYLSNQATQSDLDKLFSYVQKAGEDGSDWDFIQEGIAKEQGGAPGFVDMDDEQKVLLVQNVLAVADDQLPAAPYSPVHRIRFLQTAWFRYAAIVLLIAGAAVFLYMRDQQVQKETAKTATAAPDILPGGNKAILTLADGSTIVLDSAANGNLADQGNTKIRKLNAGLLAYNTDGSGPQTTTGEVMYNTIATPRGGQYQVVLPDGSTVWLNAVSSIRFPADFLKNRKVDVTGEAYFQVAPVKNSPFLVKAGETAVNVLGTGFNINAYNDESSVYTTLVEGSINISNGKAGAVLLPGHQATSQLSVASDVLVQQVDTEQQTAWKNRVFNFDKASIKTIMRQLSRWYNIDVVYKGTNSERFNATMPMDQPISKILKLLDTTGLVKFTIKGKTIIVE